MKKLNPPVDKKKYYEIPKGLSEYERNKVKYTPTHFTFTKVEEGFSYSSDNNKYFLNVDEIRKLIKENLDSKFVPI